MNKQQYLEKKKAESLNDNTCQWITVKQLQDKLQVSSSTIYRWTRNNVIKAYRFCHSRNIYFLNSEIDEFLRQNPITPSGRLDKVGLSIQ
ncbi:MAG: helix-turn-helix domain-containing protein [Bacteroidales bacterium]|nr:helix-turn-helix domain-containing protein [Bacteroidales bacterium]